MSIWEERAARNEALFREVNEQVRAVAAQFGSRPEESSFVCECSDDSCVEKIRVPVAVYERVRQDPRRFLLVPGHDNEFERVVERAGGYVIVEKEGGAGRIAAHTDPRGPSRDPR